MKAVRHSHEPATAPIGRCCCGKNRVPLERPHFSQIIGREKEPPANRVYTVPARGWYKFKKCHQIHYAWFYTHAEHVDLQTW